MTNAQLSSPDYAPCALPPSPIASEIDAIADRCHAISNELERLEMPSLDRLWVQTQLALLARRARNAADELDDCAAPPAPGTADLALEPFALVAPAGTRLS